MKNIYILLTGVLLLTLCAHTVNADSKSKHHRECCKHIDVRRTDAVQRSIELINKSVLAFSAAIRAPQGSPQQIEQVIQLRENFAKTFLLTLNFFGTITEANDFTSLLALIQYINGGITTFATSLVGNFVVEDFKNTCGCRTLQMQSLQYVVRTANGASTLVPESDEFSIIEEKCEEFKIKTWTFTVLSLIPLNQINSL